MDLTTEPVPLSSYNSDSFWGLEYRLQAPDYPSWASYTKTGSILPTSPAGSINQKKHKYWEKELAMANTHRARQAATDEIKDLVPKGGSSAIHCFAVFYWRFLIFSGNCNLGGSALTAPSALSAPSCTLVVLTLVQL
jgi:hypothetical protein